MGNGCGALSYGKLGTHWFGHMGWAVGEQWLGEPCLKKKKTMFSAVGLGAGLGTWASQPSGRPVLRISHGKWERDTLSFWEVGNGLKAWEMLLTNLLFNKCVNESGDD